MAGQDIRKLIPAAGGMPVNVAGDYIYLKFADRPIDVIINQGSSGQTRVTMEAGDKYRPGRFNQFEINNPDSQNAAQVIFTVGEGDYNRQLVQGEISVVPGVRKASGEFVQDTRWDLTAAVSITNAEPVTYSRESTKNTYYPGTNVSTLAYHKKGGFVLYTSSSQSHYRYDLASDSRTTIGTYTHEIGGGVEIIDTRGALDENGDLWMAGRSKSSQNAVVFKIGDDLSVSDIRGTSVKPYWSNSFPKKPLFWNGRMFFAFMDDSGDRIRLFEWLNGQFEQIKTFDYNTDFTITPKDLSIQEGALVFSQAGSSNPQAAFMLDTWESVPAGDFINGEYAMTIDEPARVYFRATSQTYFRERHFISWTKQAEGVFQTCASGYLFRPDVNITEAGITSETDSQGRVTLKGQVVRALLELYLGGFVADDYLDHVYSVTFDNESGRAPRTISAGNTTFAGADIEDNFSAVFPQSVTITLDNGLTTKD